VLRFVADSRITVLNVAGPRVSGWQQGEAYARSVVEEVLMAQRTASAPRGKGPSG
jgi:hypothetical protein